MEIETVSEPAISMETQSIDSDDSEEDEEEENFDTYEAEYAHRRRRYEDYVTIRPEILTDVPSLTQIASVCVAATLWNHVNIPEKLSTVNDRCAKKSTEWATVRKTVLSLPRRLPIPKPIAKQIKKHVSDMALEINHWVSYHFRSVFMNKGLDKVVYNHVHHIVWRSNGSINCKETAKNITSVRLIEVEKFKFLATYCLQGEIENEKWCPSVLNEAVEYVNTFEYPLIDYWYRHFRNQNNANANTINARTMFRNAKVDNWPAKEYFFDCLSKDEQVREAIWLINTDDSSTYLTAVLLKLDETQRSCVFVEQGENIIKILLQLPMNFRKGILIKICVDLLDSPTDVLSSIIELSLTDADEANAFKKSVILSSDAISKLKKLLANNRLDVVVSCDHRYLQSVEDKVTFKKLLVDDVVKHVHIILQNDDEKYLRSFMQWYLASEKAVDPFKEPLVLDLIFIDLLTKSIFTKFNQILKHSKFRASINFELVDKFLNWYFESLVDRLRYKMKIIYNNDKFEMFKALMRKDNEKYLKTLVQWFFQQDRVEIAKFKRIRTSFEKIKKFI